MFSEIHKLKKIEQCNFTENIEMARLNISINDRAEFEQALGNISNLMEVYNDCVVVQNIEDINVTRQFKITNFSELSIFTEKYLEVNAKKPTFSFEIIIKKDKLIESELKIKNCSQLADELNCFIFFDLTYFSRFFIGDSLFKGISKYSIIVLSCNETINLKNHWISILNDLENVNCTELEERIIFYNENYEKIIQKQTRQQSTLGKVIGVHDETSPEYFYFQNIDLGCKCFSIIKEKLISQILLYISKETYVSNDKVEYGLYGFRNITIQCNNIDLVDEEIYRKIYRLFSYIYTDYTDIKLEILPNVLSFYLIDELNQFEQFIKNIDKIYNSLKSNFNIHAQERIRFWFDERKKIIDYITTKTDQISVLIDNHAKVFSNTIIALVVTILGGFFQNASQMKLDILKPTLIVYFYFGITYYLYNTTMSIASYFMTLADFNHFISNESRLLHKDEIDDLIGDVIKRKKIFFGIVLTVTTFLFVILMSNIYYYFNHFERVRVIFMKF